MQTLVNIAIVFSLSSTLWAGLSLPTKSTGRFDSTFNHSHMVVQALYAKADYSGLTVEITRVGFTPSLILVEMQATNTSDSVVHFAPEQGLVMVGDFRIPANAFATQAFDDRHRDTLIEPGQHRHIVVVYPGQFGQTNWNPSQVTQLSVYLWEESEDHINLFIGG